MKKKIYFNGYLLDQEQWQELDKLVEAEMIEHRELENHKFADVFVLDPKYEEQVTDILTM
jgi:hypothetical protein